MQRQLPFALRISTESLHSLQGVVARAESDMRQTQHTAAAETRRTEEWRRSDLSTATGERGPQPDATRRGPST